MSETKGNLAAFSEQIHNAEETAPAEFSVVPAGTYHLEVVDADVRTSGSGKQYVNTQFRIVGGDYDNRRVFELYMLEGSEKSVAISLSSLRKLAEANGYDELGDTSQIIGAHVSGTVKVEKGGPKDKNDPSGEKWPDKNRVSYIKKLGDEKPAAAVSGESTRDASWF